MHRKLHHILPTLTLAAVVGVCAAPADAHFSVHRGGKLFYFDGHAYNDQGTSKIGDPTDITFTQNRAATQKATLRNINGAFASHWTGPNKMSSSSCTSFSDNEYIAWRAFRKYNGANAKRVTVQDDNILNGSVASATPCDDEYHIRFWTDHTHQQIARGSDPHGSLDQWLLGGVHHESRDFPFGSHYIDRPWDQVRDEVLRYMGTYYCHRRHFRYDPASYGNSGTKDHSYFHDGWIGEISLQAVAQGC